MIQRLPDVSSKHLPILVQYTRNYRTSGHLPGSSWGQQKSRKDPEYIAVSLGSPHPRKNPVNKIGMKLGSICRH